MQTMPLLEANLLWMTVAVVVAPCQLDGTRANFSSRLGFCAGRGTAVLTRSNYRQAKQIDKSIFFVNPQTPRSVVPCTKQLFMSSLLDQIHSRTARMVWFLVSFWTGGAGDVGSLALAVVPVAAAVEALALTRSSGQGNLGNNRPATSRSCA